jgi:hypothetical protein
MYRDVCIDLLQIFTLSGLSVVSIQRGFTFDRNFRGPTSFHNPKGAYRRAYETATRQSCNLTHAALHSGRFIGQEFDTFDPERPHRKITAIIVHSGDWIDGIEVQYDNQPGELYGGDHPHAQVFPIPEGAYLQEIYGEVGGQYINRIQFRLSNRTTSRDYGNNPGDHFTLAFDEPGTIISGIHGSVHHNVSRNGDYIEALGVWTARRISSHDGHELFGNESFLESCLR